MQSMHWLTKLARLDCDRVTEERMPSVKSASIAGLPFVQPRILAENKHAIIRLDLVWQFITTIAVTF